jgi:precorrin-4 methylase/DMSO/TMAO reductase YedYZ molybdopterin-dependent catalytic subunit
MKRTSVWLLFFLCVFFLNGNGWASAADISVTGVVKQPLHMSMDDLEKFGSVTVQLNEITSDKSFHGGFHYKGVPLKTLLKFADIEKEESDFPKRTDLAVIVRNKNGEQVTLSWGEVFYRNPGETIIAYSATPIMPHRDCQQCHAPDFYQPWLSQLHRQVGFPKLVVTGDFYTDRSLEDVTNIEIKDLHPEIDAQKLPELFSPQFTITGKVKKTLTISDLSPYLHREFYAKQMGEGKGYHGMKQCGGVSLLDLVEEAGIDPDLNTVFLISAPDGYRSLVSYGELSLSSHGRSIIIADVVSDAPIKDKGRFILIFPDDLMADRWVKAVEKIEVISLKQKPKLSVIGVGCADTNLITLEALSCMGKADVFLSPDDITKRFKKYMGNKPILFDPLQNTEYMFKKNHPDLSPDEIRKLLEEQRARDIQKIRDALSAGKHVALLEYGDPMIYGGWIYWLQEFKAQTEIIPGISAFNVSNALIGSQVVCNGSAIITVPRGLKENESMLKSVAEHGDTLVIFIGLKELKDLMPLFRKYYPETTPVDVVYKAGYSDSERVIKTTFRDVMNITEKEEEQHLGMIYVGPCLR